MNSNVDSAWLEQHPDFLRHARTQKSPPRDRAHPYPVGSGPDNQTCGTCEKCCAQTQYRRTFYKCRVMAKTWTKSLATDIRLRDRACLAWEPKTEVVFIGGPQ